MDPIRSAYFKMLVESAWTQTKSRLGSNEGGIFLHPDTCEEHYVKFPTNTEQAHVEAATADIYNAMGIRTLHPSVKSIDGREALVSKWNPSVKSLGHPLDYAKELEHPERRKELASIHHASVITKNWDSIGLGFDNVMKDTNTGELVSVDQGGSMHFRAQGGPKPFTSDISEVYTFQDRDNPSGMVYSHLNDVDMLEALPAVQNLTDDKIDGIMKKHNLGHLADVVKRRRDNLIKHYS